MGSIAPAARWASAAAAAPDLQGFAGSSELLPFQLDRVAAFGMLIQSGVQHLAPGQPEPEQFDRAWQLRTLPLHPNEIISHYDGIPKLKGLQRALSQQILNHRLHAFLESGECTNSDVVRLASCRHKTTQRWMQPSPSSPIYTDLCTTIVTRLRLGLPPLDDMPARRVCAVQRGHLFLAVARSELREAQAQDGHAEARPLLPVALPLRPQQ